MNPALVTLGSSVAVLVFLGDDDVKRARTAAWVGVGLSLAWLVAGPLVMRKLGGAR